MPSIEALPRPHHPRHLKKAFLVTAATTVGIAAVAGAASMINESQQSAAKPSFQKEVQISGGLTPVETAIRELGVTVTPFPTETAVPPTAIATKETEKEVVPCLITSPELCAQAERVQIVINGRTDTYLDFNPDDKTPFYVPEDVLLLDKMHESGDPFNGDTAVLRNPDRGYIIIGLDFENMLQVEKPKKGTVIGYSNNKGIKNLGAVVLVTVRKITPSGPVIDEEALRKISPAAYDKPIKATYIHEGPGIPNVSISYSSKPPQ